ncbi:MAG TPA: hypothetical protein VK563_05890 [Puia sp.]|nr:hypothetical protein [Puia sp.]
MIRFVTVIGCSFIYFSAFSQIPDSIRRSGRDTVPHSIPDTSRPPVQDTIPHIFPDKGKRAIRDSVPRSLRDSSRLTRWKNNNIFQFFRNAISKGGPVDSATQATALNTKSESPFKPYEGKVIRHIYIKNYGFEQTFTDTTKRLQYFGTQLLNNLHHKTRDWVIRNSLFVKENSPLSSYRLADNERLIRSLEFIQDARILVNYVPDNPDSVDLVVVVKDLFSIGGAIGELSPGKVRGNVSEANAFGMGQKIQMGMFLEQNRNPNFGYQLLYTKSNIARTFVNAAASYSQINDNIKDGTPDETTWFIRLDRPLYAPNAHLAGNITVGSKERFNRYSIPDSLFFKYRYRVRDMWLGWNLGTEKFLGNTTVRDRRFLGVRYFNDHFYEVPTQIGDKFNFRFNDRQGVLGTFTFFRQDFYKTNYIYGFGTTEDVPEGYNVALTGGWFKQLYLERPYAGVDANRYLANSKGDFIQYFLRSGAFLKNHQLQDASFLIGSSLYSRLYVWNRLKLRQYVNFSYSRQFNRIGIDPLTIDNLFGLRYFSGDSTFGSQRITLHSETTFFLNYKLLGFKFATFAFGDLSLLTPEHEPFSKSSLYHGVGAGMRSRNENLVFQTIEFRFAYFPRPTRDNNSFKIMITTGIQFRYNNTFVKAPDIVQLNTDGLNSIY